MKAVPRIADNTHTPTTNPGAALTADRWQEYERRKKALPPMRPAEYEEAVRRIAKELGV